MLAKVICLLVLVNCMYCAPKEEFQSAACAVDDFQCNSEATKNFVKKTASGDAALGIKPYDPLIIDTLTSNRVDGVVAEFKNINVTGLRNQNLTEIKFDKVAKTAVYALTVDVNVASEIYVEYEETKKKYSGTFTASGKAVIRTTFNYELKPDDKGVEHLESGPETTTCEFSTFNSETSQDLLDAVANDSHANKIYQEQLSSKDTIQKETTCDILKIAYGALWDAARKVEKAYPANVFFSDA